MREVRVDVHRVLNERACGAFKRYTYSHYVATDG